MERRKRPVAVVHPALRPPATGRRARTDPACRGAGAGGGGSAVGGVSDASVGVSGASGGGSVRRLPAPRRSSLDFEPAKPRPPPPRGQLVLTNLRSVERETLLPVVAKLGDVAVMEEVCGGGGMGDGNLARKWAHDGGKWRSRGGWYGEC